MVEKRVKKFGQGPPPPLFGQCPKEIDFSYGRSSLRMTASDLDARFRISWAKGIIVEPYQTELIVEGHLALAL